MLARLLLLAAFLGLSAPMLAQTGHPAKGSWSGDLVVGDSDKSRVRLLIDAWNGELSGTVNPGRNAAEMSSIELDAASWTLTIRAAQPDGELVLTGTLSNLGSWNNRKYIGTWTKGAAKGTFDFTLN